MSKAVRYILFILATPLFFWLTHYMTFLPHEYFHSLVATLAGFKQHFWNIHYGGHNFWNIVFLVNCDSNVNYAAMYAAHKNWLVALTAFAGPGFGNGLTYLVSLWGLCTKSIKQRPWLWYFFFWWNINSIGNLIDYIPSRTFASHGDMGYITQSLNMSPWWLIFTFGYLITWTTVHFYRHTFMNCMSQLKLTPLVLKCYLLACVTFVLFALYGTVGLHDYGSISHVFSMLSFWIIPIIIFLMIKKLMHSKSIL